MGDRTRGLYGKFRIERTDGKSAPGEKHDGCFYFVLDVAHDPHALPALAAYADSARRDGYGMLADDIEDQLLAGYISAPCAEVSRLTAEVERLTRELNAYKRAKAENDDRYMGERDEARRRVAELEAALREIADWGCNLDPIAPCFKRDDGGKCLPCIARAALAAKEPA